ncbi:hypothetical protein P3T76_005356 [Phytophthora citrophthora]|uniref:RxLR effector protein n=1 Tax=Phytophthora citrophthora TaxID=4793 RepID=A0AAD9GSI1_9STRA|nr:hypothetical protein P3T76_005356 [Phytophthora citrophthora]
MKFTYVLLLVLCIVITTCDALSTGQDNEYQAVVSPLAKRSLRTVDTIESDDEEERGIFPSSFKNIIKKGTSKASDWDLMHKYKSLQKARWSDDDIYQLWVRQRKDADKIYTRWIRLGKSEEQVSQLFLRNGLNPEYLYSILTRQGKSMDDIYSLWQKVGLHNGQIYNI